MTLNPEHAPQRIDPERAQQIEGAVAPGGPLHVDLAQPPTEPETEAHDEASRAAAVGAAWVESNQVPRFESAPKVGEDEHGVFAAGGGLTAAAGWRVPADQLYSFPSVTVPRGGMIFGGATATAADQPVVIDSLAELRELDEIDLRRWARSTRKLLDALGYPLDRLNQIIADLIFAEED